MNKLECWSVSCICALCGPSSAALCWNVGESQPRFFCFYWLSRSRTKTAKYKFMSCSNSFVQSAQGRITSRRNTKSNSRLYLVGYACSWIVHSLLNTVCRLHLGTKVSTDSVRIDFEHANKAWKPIKVTKKLQPCKQMNPNWSRWGRANKQVEGGILTILRWKHKVSTWSVWKVQAWCSSTFSFRMNCWRLYSQICFVWFALLGRNGLMTDTNTERQKVEQLDNKRSSKYWSQLFHFSK